MESPHIPGRMVVKKIHQHQLWQFRCDDRAGFLLQVIWAFDGDLHLSIVPDPDHEDRLNCCQYLSGSVRLRLPMIGGGMYEHLQPALMKAMVAERAEEAQRYPDSVVGAFPLETPEVSRAAQDVLAERERQIDIEEWTDDHDDRYPPDLLARAAACYAMPVSHCVVNVDGLPSAWPWDPHWWKPKTRRYDLVRAGALIIAEIERMDRAAAKEKS